jgi:hypothetical protein
VKHKRRAFNIILSNKMATGEKWRGLIREKQILLFPSFDGGRMDGATCAPSSFDNNCCAAT